MMKRFRVLREPRHGDSRRIIKFAWLPTRMSFGYWIWLVGFADTQVFFDSGYIGDGHWETIGRNDNV